MRRLQECESFCENETAPEPPPRTETNLHSEPPPLPPKKHFSDFHVKRPVNLHFFFIYLKDCRTLYSNLEEYYYSTFSSFFLSFVNIICYFWYTQFKQFIFHQQDIVIRPRVISPLTMNRDTAKYDYLGENHLKPNISSQYK